MGTRNAVTVYRSVALRNLMEVTKKAEGRCMVNYSCRDCFRTGLVKTQVTDLKHSDNQR
jgi:hypothetical protein